MRGLKGAFSETALGNLGVVSGKLFYPFQGGGANLVFFFLK